MNDDIVKVAAEGIVTIPDGSVTSAKLAPAVSSLLTITGSGQPNGVVTGTVGQKYIDTAATAGAVEWMKMSGSGNTGWVCTLGDTGWRIWPTQTLTKTVGGQANVSWEVAIACRRINNVVMYGHTVKLLTALTATTGSSTFYLDNGSGESATTLTGFMHPRELQVGNAGSVYSNSLSFHSAVWYRNPQDIGGSSYCVYGMLNGATAARASISTNTTYFTIGTTNPPTSEAWPTVLPGSAFTP